MKETKCLEYYLDSKKYTKEKVKENIEETKKEFPNKKIEVETTINQYGMYVITFYFENKNTIFNKIRIYLKKRRQKTLLLEESKENKNRLEKYYGHKYGAYKATKQYKPY